MRLFARGRAVTDSLERGEALLDQRQRALLGGHHGEVGAQRMRRCEVGVLGERLVERRERIAEVAECLAHGQVVFFERGHARVETGKPRESVSFMSDPRPWVLRRLPLYGVTVKAPSRGASKQRENADAT